tara:strand:- start:1319 stop:1786 length:468 start_codon:yes stop_codon:yes gene_type:complete
MRNFQILLTLSFFLLLFSCSKDTEGEQSEDISGTYELSMARDECPDSANNGSVNATSDGVCINLTNGSECYEMTLKLNSDNTYTFAQITTFTNGGIMNSTNASEAGNYTVNETRVTTTDLGGVVTIYSMDNTGDHLDWTAATTDVGCERIFRFSK